MGVAILCIVGAIVLYAIYTFNRLVRLRNRIDNAWSQIDVQIKKRTDLVPNLVETVKGYAKHERETFEIVTKARAAVAHAGTVKEKGEAYNQLTGALKSLFAVSERYTDLKANQNFLNLQEELSGIENKIAYARQFYNDTLLMYNNGVETFPGVVVAKFINYQAKDDEYFEIEEVERVVPKVAF